MNQYEQKTVDLVRDLKEECEKLKCLGGLSMLRLVETKMGTRAPTGVECEVFIVFGKRRNPSENVSSVTEIPVSPPSH